MRIHDIIDRPPNIVLFAWEGMGDCFGIHGRRDVHAPYSDMLGYQGMVFDAVTPTPLLRQALPPLPDLLGRAHYHRVAIGMPIGHLAQYDEHHATDAGNVEEMYVAAEQALVARASHAEHPFLLTFCLDPGTLTRAALAELSADNELAAALTLPEGLDDTPENRHLLAAWYGQIHRADYYIGRLMDEVDDRGLDEDTMVIVAGDGQPPFVFPGPPRGTLILRWSSILPGGWRGESPVSFVDLLPTIAELAGVEGLDLPGTSLLPLLEGS